ncbi:hypothetical protein Glove_359g9 [Diversispora epigaea]|uniref:Uncharacterized protein n=1 Tax=Diversispora epigaea TaxID=1348612 RepID=A0A397HAB3_9GLOM|nr:hypothetical protein Glove_359g9 [Diversispora epigaea]
MKILKQLLHPRRLYFPEQSVDEDKLPYLIGSKKTIKEYNNFLERQESSGYKYQRENNGDVYIIDMSNEEHDSVVGLIQRYFNAPNNNIIFDPPIGVSGDRFHFNPLTSELIAPDVAVYPNDNYVQPPRIPYPGPPPGSKQGKVHARIICEIGNCQSTENWIAKCQLWMNQVYVRYVLGIKLHTKRNTRNLQGRYHRSMTANLWQQGIAVPQTWDFGTLQRGNNVPTACNAPNLPGFRIDIPIAQVFWDPPIHNRRRYVPRDPPAITDVNFSIDLYLIQQEVLRMQGN